MQDLWQEAGEEPSIAELLDDPIAELLRAYDGLREADVWLAVEQARCQLRAPLRAA